MVVRSGATGLLWCVHVGMGSFGQLPIMVAKRYVDNEKGKKGDGERSCCERDRRE